VFFGVAGVSSAWMPNYIAFALILIPVGLGSLTFLNSCNTMVQTSVPPQYRARVLSLYLMVVMGGTPIGSPLIGWFAELFGIQVAVSIGAGLSLAASLVALLVWQKFKTNAVPLRSQFREMLGR
ncbi:MFS transporter, partial [Glutamicibacter arilaitensis]